MGGPATVLMSSAGRRVELLQLFRAAGAGRIVVADTSPRAATRDFADAFYLVPPCDHPRFVEAMLGICATEQVDLVVPLIDPELPIWALHQSLFQATGVLVAVSGRQTVQLGADKVALAHHLRDLVRSPVLPRHGPVITKPRFGSGSLGLQRYDGLSQVPPSVRADPAMIVQEQILGREFSVDLFVAGSIRATYVREQLTHRAGEVNIGAAVEAAPIADVAMRAVESLPDAFGILHADLVLEAATQEPVLLEINPRIPGGYPLSHAAGAPMLRWLLDLAQGRQPDYSQTPFRPVEMARYELGSYRPISESVTLAD